MKALRFIITILSLLAYGCAQSQTIDEKAVQRSANVEAIEITTKSKSVYTSAANQWKSVVEANKLDENAWINYYKALRYENYTDHSRNISKEKQQVLNGVLSEMSKAVPSSFSFQYASYLNGSKSDASFDFLRKAWELHPGETELIDDMLCDAIIRKNESQISQFAGQLSTAGVYNAAEVEYNKNVFNSIEQQGILITNGNVDTYPLILMQKLQGFRNDITIICTEWLGSESYRKTAAEALDIADWKTLNAEKLLKYKTSRPVYVALTLPPDFLKKNSGNLFCTGLAMRHSKDVIENLPSLDYNWSFLFSKSQIKSSDAINRNYLMPMILLRSHYALLGKDQESQALLIEIKELSGRFGLNKELKNYID